MVAGGVFAVCYAVCIKRDCHIDVKSRASGKPTYGTFSLNDDDSSQEDEQDDEKKTDAKEGIEMSQNAGGDGEDRKKDDSTQGTKSPEVRSSRSSCYRRCSPAGILCTILFILYQAIVIFALCLWLIIESIQTRR